jgi:aspartyl-tRNA(Asn)/glutamyl-tRNA(Gln) amidotransferase subunit A
MLDDDPLGPDGLFEFAQKLRAGAITSEAATRSYLARIEALDGRLGAYQHVAHSQALASARAMDALLAAGTDLGPLMGVPIGIKDLYAVEGMPTTAGTKMDVQDLIGPEGRLVRSLKRAGCVILGKTKTVEFALGITGVSAPRGTPVNPWDAATVRVPGGSSSGSAVAVAAGLCAFALGSDTGGSVRVPAAFNGLFGLKTTPGLLSNDGALPLVPHLDSGGFLTRSAADASIVLSAITGLSVIPARLDALRFGVPQEYYFDALEPGVEGQVRAAMETLAHKGVGLEPFSVPQARERESYFPVVLPACLLATLGRERFQAGRDAMDPIVAKRAATGLDVKAFDYLTLEGRRQVSSRSAAAKFAGLDAWIAPTTAVLPPALADFEDDEKALNLALGMTRNTQPANYFGFPAVTVPIPQEPGNLPVGLQIICPPGQDARAVSIALAVETALGRAGTPDLSGFSR